MRLGCRRVGVVETGAVWPNEGNMDCCWSWLIVGLLRACWACWAANGLLRWPWDVLAVIDDCVTAVVAATAVLPNGFVLFGRGWLGIKFSRLTSAEFSPRKLSGVFRVGLMPVEFLFVAAAAADDVTGFMSKSFDVANGSMILLVAADESAFHGFVDGFEFDELAPKKSPNGSSSGLLLPVAWCVSLRLAFRLLVNKSKSSWADAAAPVVA